MTAPNPTQVHLAGMAGETYGSADDPRPPLVMIHGLTFDRTMWPPTVDELQRLQPGRRVLLVDLPGHGRSDPIAGAFSLLDIVDRVHAAADEAGLGAPIVVGHSLGGVIVTMYAWRHPTAGVVNADQTLDTGSFLHFLHGMRDQLQGPGFPAIWQQLAAGFHADQLPPDMQEIVRRSSTPEQRLVLAYWNELWTLGPDGIDELSAEGLAALAESGVPYLTVFGSEPEAGYEEWLRARLPQATTVRWPNGSHFPHLARPDEFAQLLATTAEWPARSSLTAGRPGAGMPAGS